MKDQVDLFSNDVYETHYRSDIRDTYKGTGIQSPLLQCSIYQLYQKNQDIEWLANVYDAAENDADWRYANRRDTNGLYYCGGLECGDGRGSDVVAPDVNAEMYYLYDCMEQMALALEYASDVSKWQSRGTFLDGHIDDFYKDCNGYGPIFSDLTKNTLTCKTDRDDATSFSFKLLYTNHSEINDTMIQSHINALTNTSRYDTNGPGLPDISQSDIDFNEGGGLWWHGNRWSILSQFAAHGLYAVGETAMAERMRNETIELISQVSTGPEWFKPTGTDHSGDGNINWYGWTMSNIVRLMNDGEYNIQEVDADLQISNIRVSPSITQFTISWNNNIPANCTLQYDDTIALENMLYDEDYTTSCSFIINDLPSNTTYYFNGTSCDEENNCVSTGLLQNKTEIDYPEDNSSWIEKFDEVHYSYRDGGGYTHWGFYDAWFQEQSNMIESYLLMFNATGDDKYLSWASYQLDNYTNSYEEWIDITEHTFTRLHLGGNLMWFAYEAKYRGNQTHQDKADEYVAFVEDILLPQIRTDGYDTPVDFTYDGLPIHWLKGDGGASTKPLNQVYGYFLLNIYAYAVTLNETYQDNAQGLANGYLVAMNRSVDCTYDVTKACMNTPYRMYFGQDFETSLDPETDYGFPPTVDNLNYIHQSFEPYYRAWKHGFLPTSVITEVANTIYYNMYLQEGGLDNVLISKSWNYPSTTYTDYHEFYSTHYTSTIHYYEALLPDIGPVADQIRNDIYAFVRQEDGTFKYFEQAGYPYGTITDPRTGVSSTYCSDYDYCIITADKVMKHIAASLINPNYQFILADDEEPPVDVTPPVISALSVGNIGLTSARIIFTTDEAANASVYYESQTNNSINGSVVQSTRTTSHSILLSGLLSNKTYDYELFGVCDIIGNCAANNTGSFTTLSTSVNPDEGGLEDTLMPLVVVLMLVSFLSFMWIFINEESLTDPKNAVLLIVLTVMVLLGAIIIGSML
jgi:hypothetical protein